MKFNILEKRAGDFIDLENYFKEMVIETKEETVIKFFELLIGEVPTKESEIKEIILEYSKQITDIKDTFIWLYNPPQMPSNINNEFKNKQHFEDFANDYSGYIEIIYLLCKGDFLKLDLVGQMKTQDFLFYGEYLVRKRFIENVK